MAFFARFFVHLDAMQKIRQITIVFFLIVFSIIEIILGNTTPKLRSLFKLKRERLDLCLGGVLTFVIHILSTLLL